MEPHTGPRPLRGRRNLLSKRRSSAWAPPHRRPRAGSTQARDPRPFASERQPRMAAEAPARRHHGTGSNRRLKAATHRCIIHRSSRSPRGRMNGHRWRIQPEVFCSVVQPESGFMIDRSELPNRRFPCDECPIRADNQRGESQGEIPCRAMGPAQRIRPRPPYRSPAHAWRHRVRMLQRQTGGPAPSRPGRP
jgi:hypothetical protein